MNRLLIAELAKKADFEVCEDGFVWETGVGEMSDKIEDFAKLIVDECKKAIDPKGDLCSMHESIWREACMKMIDERFGVE